MRSCAHLHLERSANRHTNKRMATNMRARFAAHCLRMGKGSRDNDEENERTNERAGASCPSSCADRLVPYLDVSETCILQPAQEEFTMYIADLSTSTYSLQPPKGYSVLSIGWLDELYPFPHGPTPPEFQERLREHCTRGVHAPMMGIHECQFCGNWCVGVQCGNTWVMTNSGEIWIPDGDIIYAAPVMIYHYVTDHEYRPPDVFIGAVMRCPLPYEEKYQAFMRSIGMRTYDWTHPS